MFWLLAIVVTAVACAALYYAARTRPVNATAGTIDEATTAHFRLQLTEIDSDIASGRLNAAEGTAARAELARELVRLRGEGRTAGGALQRPVLLLAIGATAVLALGAYTFLGSPNLPSAPLAERALEEMTLEQAIGRIEAQLTRTPDDLRGWVAVAPAYMQQQRFADAERAYRRIIELDGATADRESDLGEAVMMRQQGDVSGEPLDLFRSAAARDPEHIRSRFYLAGEATRSGEFQSAIEQWNDLIARATTGEEPWLATARAGLAAAEEGLNSGTGMPGEADIAGMVEGLASRLASDGGTVAEWTQLVRSRLVLGQTELAQQAYDAARAAHPDAAQRTELDVLAADNGLVAN